MIYHYPTVDDSTFTNRYINSINICNDQVPILGEDNASTTGDGD